MKVIITEPAKYRLKELYFFYKAYMPTQKAKEIRTDILNKIKTLSSFSEKGALEESLINSDFEYRYILERHCKIIYRIENETVFVTDFFDSRQAPEKLPIRNK